MEYNDDLIYIAEQLDKELDGISKIMAEIRRIYCLFGLCFMAQLKSEVNGKKYCLNHSDSKRSGSNMGLTFSFYTIFFGWKLTSARMTVSVPYYGFYLCCFVVARKG